MSKEPNFCVRIARTLWNWGPIYRNCHRPSDDEFSSIWSIPRDAESIKKTVQSCLPHLQEQDLPSNEDELRGFLRKQYSLETDKPEELWPEVPQPICRLLIALNGTALSTDMQSLLTASYHTRTGLRTFSRSVDSYTKITGMFQHGRNAVLSKTERFCLNLFFLFCLYNTITTDLWAGLLGERAYNVRSAGSRVITLIQMFYMYHFQYGTMLLLFNWSLERVTGSLVGNLVYGVTAWIPAVGAYRGNSDFRLATLVVSVLWQLGVQFYLPIRDSINLFFIRHQGSSKKYSETKEDILSDQRQLELRCHRFILACKTFRFGRTMDQLMSIVKDDIEICLQIYENYLLASSSKGQENKRYAEPWAPKFLLVVVDALLFAFVDFSFFTLPFTFNLVVAYGLVVTIKQALLCCRRYQTMQSARRLFTNMAGQNVWGIFLVALPFRIDQNVFDSPATFSILLVAVTFAYSFLTEPIVYLVEFATKPLMPSPRAS